MVRYWASRLLVMAGIALAFSIGATYAAEDKIDPEILEMTGAEWGRLNLFVRESI